MVSTHKCILTLTFVRIYIMKIALVHDDLVQWGGAERVLEALCEIFPDALIFTSVFDKNNPILKEKFAKKKVVTSFLQKIPGWRSSYKSLLPLYPIAFEQFDFTEFDLVISQTTRFAKAIITKPNTTHVCYCHTPPRFLWNFSGETVNPLLQPYLSFLRIYDQMSSKRVDYFIAGSKNAQNRIKKIYQADSKVIYPFVNLSPYQNIATFNGGYFLTISRLNYYKRIDLCIEAASKLKIPLKIIGDGPYKTKLTQIASNNVEFLGRVSEELLIKIIAGCKALIVPAEEDFGLTSLEAQALGKPIIAFGQGGALETVINGETGYLFPEQTTNSLIDSLQLLDKKGYNRKKSLEQAASFSKEKFIKNFQELIRSL